jgi:hypothetical protein
MTTATVAANESKKQKLSDQNWSMKYSSSVKGERGNGATRTAATHTVERLPYPWLRPNPESKTA